MKPLLNSTAALLLLLSVTPAHATPFAPGEVSARANWYAHADLDTLRNTEIGSRLMAKINEEHGPKLKAVKRMFSLNPIADLQGITLWGSGEKDKAAVIIRGRFDPAHLTDLLASSDGYKSWDHDGTMIHMWKDKEKTQFGAFLDGNVAVISEQKGFVTETVDVFEGRSPALKGEFDSSAAVFALGVANLEKIDVEGEESQMLEKAKSLGLRLFEDGDHVHAELTVETHEEEHATRLKKVLEGIIALGELSNDKLAAMNLPSSVRVSDGTIVTASVSAPHEHMLKLLELDKMFN